MSDDEVLPVKANDKNESKDMNRYSCTDGNGQIDIEAESAQAAAQEFVDGGEWGRDNKTFWVSVQVTLLDQNGDDTDESESITITKNPSEPDCCGGSHDWISPLKIVGGIRENPGVYCHGGGVIITQVCRHCGRYCITDTWAQNPENGEQGLESTEYRDADETSESWVAGHKENAERGE